MAIHEERIFMIYVMDQLAEKETFFINLSKLIELKFIPTS